nr:retrovirus-related Pol polyprotein from transposon TNT 1-94 [Tanacetum cinerariifolium]
ADNAGCIDTHKITSGGIQFLGDKTEYQLANMFTKALPEDRFKYLVRRIGNKSFLLDYQEYNGGFVAFAGSSKGGKITGKDFKLPDENQVLLKVPRKNNMYSFDLKNVVPSKGLTCLFTKATNDESNLWHMRLPIISFMRPFGYLVTILNTLDHLGKFDGKADEGFLAGYSLTCKAFRVSKAFRVYNIRTKKVDENLHVNFLENKPNVAGSGSEWLLILIL